MFVNILKGTITGLVAKSTVLVGSLLIIPFMLKQLGSTNYGLWITISSTASLLSFMDLGIGSNLINYIAKAGKNKKKIIEFINLAYIVQTVFIGIICLLFISLFDFINWNKLLNIENQTAEINQTIFFTFIFFLFSLITNTIYSVQRGLQRSDVANIWQLLSSVSYLGSLWLILLISPNLLAVSLITFGVPVIIAILNTIWFLSYKKLFYFKRIAFNLNEVRGFIFNSAGFLYLQIAAIIAFQTDALILAHVLNFESVSKYYITARIFYLPTLFLNVYLNTLWPAYAEASVNNNWTWIKNTFYKNIIGSFIVVLPYVLAVFFLKDLLFTSWLKSRIIIPDSLIIACGVWAIIYNCLEIHLATLLNGLNLIKIQAISAVLMIIANVGLSIFLTQRMGVTGVVWGTVLSTFLFSTIPLFIYINKVFKNKKDFVLVAI